MRRFRSLITAAVAVALLAACYRLPLRIKTNDATGDESVGVPLIEAVEYTPAGRDIRVSLEAPGYVTVILVDPERGATVRFRRGELRSQFAEKGLHRYPLDRISSPLNMAQLRGAGTASGGNGGGSRSRPVTMPVPSPVRASVFDAAPLYREPASRDTAQRATLLTSRAVAAGFGPVSSVHVVVLVTELPLDLIGVATRLARGSLDPALIAQSAADVSSGGRWMAAVAPLRGQ